MILAVLLAAATLSQAEAEARLTMLDQAARAQEAKLAAAEAPLAALLATAQRLALRPPALAIVRPGAADEAVRTRALIASLAPEIRRRTAALRHEIIATDALRAQTEQALAALLDGGQDDRLAQSPRETARLASLTGPSFVVAAGHPPLDAYHLPARGNVVLGTGERSGVGVRARGLTITTAPGATVTAPAMGRVAYAGPFRGYGDIVILDHGHGWTTILAGLERAGAASGEIAAAGAPLGQMGRNKPRLTIELRHGGRSFDVAAMALQ